MVVDWTDSNSYVMVPQQIWLWAGGGGVGRIPELIVMGQERLMVPMLVTESLHD